MMSEWSVASIEPSWWQQANLKSTHRRWSHLDYHTRHQSPKREGWHHRSRGMWVRYTERHSQTFHDFSRYDGKWKRMTCKGEEMQRTGRKKRQHPQLHQRHKTVRGIWSMCLEMRSLQLMFMRVEEWTEASTNESSLCLMCLHLARSGLLLRRVQVLSCAASCVSPQGGVDEQRAKKGLKWVVKEDKRLFSLRQCCRGGDNYDSRNDIQWARHTCQAHLSSTLVKQTCQAHLNMSGIRWPTFSN